MSGLSQRRARALAAALFATLLPPSLRASSDSCEQPASPTKLAIGLEWFLNPDHIPLVVALREGYFAAAGLDVELKEPADHWEAEAEILNGRLDVAVTETLHLAQDAAKGKAVVGFSRFLHTDGGVMYAKASGITRPRDMCGRTISYPGYPGPGGPAIVQTMVEADGGECDVGSYGKHDGGFYHTKAIAEERAELATLVFYNFELIEAASQRLDVDYFSLKEWGVPDFCQLVLFTTPARFSALKPQLRALLLALRRAVGVVQRQPARTTAIYNAFLAERGTLPADGTDELRVHQATVEATLPAFPNDNSVASEYFQGLMAWLVRTGQVDATRANATPPSAYWTNEIAL